MIFSEGFSSVCFSLKNETTRTLEHLDQQVQEQEKLRQSARTMSSILQRAKAQLLEIHPSFSTEADQALKVCTLAARSHHDRFDCVENRRGTGA